MGNGQGVVKVLAKHGATTILADISDQVFATAEQMKQEGLDVHAVQMNVTNNDSVKQAVSTTVDKFGKIDALVNNTGVVRLANFLDISDETRDFQFNRRTLDVKQIRFIYDRTL